MQYDIYQVKDRDDEAMEAGHQMFRGSKHFKPENFGFFQKVCSVDGRYCGLVNGDMDYTIKSKDEVFAILNQQYLDEDTGEDAVFENHVSGFEMKTITRKDGEQVTYRNMHSLSVGDIIAEVPQVGYEVMDPSDVVKHTTYHMVDNFGFADITDQLLDIELAQNKIRESV